MTQLAAGDQPRPAGEKPGTGRLSSFSDCILSIIMTIMVLELKVPHDPSPAALGTLWPLLVCYALSYLIIALIWVNHHHLVHHTRHAEPRVLWSNFLLLFLVSLIPFTTEYVGVTRLARLPTALYAANFFLVSSAFLLFEKQVARQLDRDDTVTLRARARAAKRNWFTFWAYLIAIPAALVHPAVALSLLLGNAMLFVLPDALELRSPHRSGRA